MRTIEAVEHQRGEATRMKRVAYAALFFLAGILFPVLIWVGLFVAIRQPLVRAARRVGSVMLALLLGMLAPILIWVGFGVAIRQLLLRWWERRAALKPAMVRQRGFGTLGKAGYVGLAFLVTILMPLLIWVALGIAIRELLHRWSESRLPPTLVCRIDTDCPPSYMCLAGRCVPQF